MVFFNCRFFLIVSYLMHEIFKIAEKAAETMISISEIWLERKLSHAQIYLISEKCTLSGEKGNKNENPTEKKKY